MFFKNKSELFELTNNARTYIIFDEEDQESKILAYFSLSFKEVSLPIELSKTQVKDIDGISKNAKFSRGFLLGQIGKNFFGENNIKISDIFEEIYSVIYIAYKAVGGRVLFLECLNNEKLKSLYENEGFRFLKVREDSYLNGVKEEDKMIVMYKKLNFE
ncbi:MAG: acetyltransferase [Candidatus Sericytochromatia bacterium]